MQEKGIKRVNQSVNDSVQDKLEYIRQQPGWI